MSGFNGGVRFHKGEGEGEAGDTVVAPSIVTTAQVEAADKVVAPSVDFPGGVCLSGPSGAQALRVIDCNPESPTIVASYSVDGVETVQQIDRVTSIKFAGGAEMRLVPSSGTAPDTLQVTGAQLDVAAGIAATSLVTSDIQTDTFSANGNVQAGSAEIGGGMTVGATLTARALRATHTTSLQGTATILAEVDLYNTLNFASVNMAVVQDGALRVTNQDDTTVFRLDSAGNMIVQGTAQIAKDVTLSTAQVTLAQSAGALTVQGPGKVEIASDSVAFTNAKVRVTQSSAGTLGFETVSAAGGAAVPLLELDSGAAPLVRVPANAEFGAKIYYGSSTQTNPAWFDCTNLTMYRKAGAVTNGVWCILTDGNINRLQAMNGLGFRNSPDTLWGLADGIALAGVGVGMYLTAAGVKLPSGGSIDFTAADVQLAQSGSALQVTGGINSSVSLVALPTAVGVLQFTPTAPSASAPTGSVWWNASGVANAFEADSLIVQGGVQSRGGVLSAASFGFQPKAPADTPSSVFYEVMHINSENDNALRLPGNKINSDTESYLNFGNIVTTGLTVNGVSALNGHVNSGNIATNNLHVTGSSVLNGTVYYGTDATTATGTYYDPTTSAFKRGSTTLWDVEPTHPSMRIGSNGLGFYFTPYRIYPSAEDLYINATGSTTAQVVAPSLQTQLLSFIKYPSPSATWDENALKNLGMGAGVLWWQEQANSNDESLFMLTDSRPNKFFVSLNQIYG
jgi:hypothetical protein